MTIRTLYYFASGPMTWAGLLVFGLGMAWRAGRFFAVARRRDRAALAGFRSGWAAASVLHFLVPLNRTARANPWTTLAGFLFHASFLVLGLFATAHVVLWELAWGVSWPALPDAAADVLALAGLAALAFLAGRRLLVPVWRGLSAPSDYLILAMVALPLLTGFLAHRQTGGETMALLHVITANVLLMVAPFTKLSHAVFFFISRSLTGSDFGKRNVGAW